MKPLKSLTHEFDLSKLRLVVLDNPEPMIKDETVKKLIADIIVTRQEGYKRASGNYLSLDKLDLIGTHILLCDVTNIYQPKIISGLRLSYNNRCSNYGIHLPMEDNIKYASMISQKAYEDFKNSRTVVAESNSWFVDSEFSYSKTKLDIGNIILTALVLCLLRQGQGSFISASNEKFKASRWVDFGRFEDGHLFTHPQIQDPHKILLVEEFDYSLIKERVEKFEFLYGNALELISSPTHWRSYEDIKTEIDLRAQQAQKVA